MSEDDPTILEEANRITSHARQQAYGPPREHFAHAARILNAIRGTNLTGSDIIYALLAVKLSRQQHMHKRDNLTDIAGYTWALNELQRTDMEADKP